jgi:hypothetical protein
MAKETDNEIAALKARVAELEARTKPPEPPKPFVPTPHQQYGPTANMTMPPSALRAMVDAVPDHMLRDIVRDHRGAPTGPTTMNPSLGQHAHRGAAVPGDGTGWAREIPLGPSPHQRYVDAQIDAQDAKDRAALVEREARLQAVEKVTEQIETMKKQTEALAKLGEGKP